MYKQMEEARERERENKIQTSKLLLEKYSARFVPRIVWRSKIWASDLGPGTSFHQQHARGEEITEDRCN